jgi:hypothetical protein
LHLVEQCPRLPASVAPAQAYAEPAQLDVLENTQVSKDPRSLKGPDEPHVSQALWRSVRDIALIEEHSTSRKALEAANRVDEGGFSGAVRPNQTQNLRALQDEIDVVDCPNSAIVNGQLLGTKCHLAIVTPISSC